ncbi:16025_t:CDS:2, partial [Racocetra fulgida]
FFIRSFITDLGLSKKLKESASKGEVYGVMPYIAPEILLVISSKLSKWQRIISKSRKDSDIKRSFISANEEIKTQIILPNYQNSMYPNYKKPMYTSILINTKEIKSVYESATGMLIDTKEIEPATCILINTMEIKSIDESSTNILNTKKRLNQYMKQLLA